MYGIILFLAANADAATRVRPIAVGMGAFLMLALIFSVAAATRRGLRRANRRAWWLHSLGFTCMLLIPATGAAPGANTRMEQVHLTSATLGDLFRLLMVPCILAGLLSFPRRETTRRDGYKVALDITTVIGGTFMLIWYFVIGPVIAAHTYSSVTLAVVIAYPVGDLVLIFGSTMVLLRGSSLSSRRPVALFLTGLAFLVASDCYLGYLRVHTTSATAFTMPLGLSMTGLFLMAGAALEQCLQATGHAPAERNIRTAKPASRLPYGALGVGYALLLTVAV